MNVILSYGLILFKSKFINKMKILILLGDFDAKGADFTY